MESREIAFRYFANVKKLKDIYKNVEDSHHALHHLLCFLYLHRSEEVNAGDIAADMRVSTARVAKLLKQVESKGLIIRKNSLNDKRVTVVELTEEGFRQSKELVEKGIELVQKIIEGVGVEKMDNFMSTFSEIVEFIEKRKS